MRDEKEDPSDETMTKEKEEEMKQPPVYSIVIPVYNTDVTLTRLVERLNHVFESEVKEPFEILFVDDGSPNPQTWKTLESLSKAHPQVVAIRLMRNFGQIPAMICGLAHTQGSFVITMDDDLQHAPEDIPKFIAERHHDVVVGRFETIHHGPLRRLTHQLKSLLDTVLLGKPRGLEMSSFCLMRRPIVDGICDMVNPYPLFTYLLFVQTHDAVNVTVEHHKRKEGKSGYSHYKRFQLFTNLIINHSPILLSLLGLLGLFLLLVSGFSLVFLGLRTLVSRAPVSSLTLLFWTFLLAFGIVFTALGIIGKYCFRILQVGIHRPLYRVRSILGRSHEAG